MSSCIVFKKKIIFRIIRHKSNICDRLVWLLGNIKYYILHFLPTYTIFCHFLGWDFFLALRWHLCTVLWLLCTSLSLKLGQIVVTENLNEVSLVVTERLKVGLVQRSDSYQMEWQMEWQMAMQITLLSIPTKLDQFFLSKVHIFWEGHKNLQNLHRQFDSM